MLAFCVIASAVSFTSTSWWPRDTVSARHRLRLSHVATTFFTSVQVPGLLAVAVAAVLLAAAVVASWLPAARASRIDVIEAVRSEEAVSDAPSRSCR
jgi:ABC-type antimicrobial peptide transport system permease subunit